MPADRRPAEEGLMEKLFALIPDRRELKGDPSCPSKT
jgi:hypothetical protein